MTRLVIVLTLLTAPLLAAATTPTAAAHACTAQDPEENCGECTERWWDSDDHRHQYADGTNYCKSGEGCDTALAARPDVLDSYAPLSASFESACGAISVLP